MQPASGDIEAPWIPQMGLGYVGQGGTSIDVRVIPAGCGADIVVIGGPPDQPFHVSRDSRQDRGGHSQVEIFFRVGELAKELKRQTIRDVAALVTTPGVSL